MTFSYTRRDIAGINVADKMAENVSHKDNFSSFLL
jgi:hypothetical protein